jgi:hypothetical protein
MFIYQNFTVLHPYYKLAYIKLAWGGADEQAEEIAAGNPDAKDWQDEAKKIVENTVRWLFYITILCTVLNTMKKMAEYYRNRPSVAPTPASTSNPEPSIALSEFDKHRESLLNDDAEEGWASELRRYLGTMQRDIKKDSDIVEWWQVSFSFTKMLATLLK